ncbi:hypothetical protein MWU57_07240 [Isoptericola sp. S6320L]|uniref:hypothetical protein n=1 Tax=Isoptericola sp. S6320L TaxID=2926411 RepID=UPI001FF65EC4|nr:hypothetical protein [Isoptericola sp. S6320L]MCK0116825.1 hypothetical protein [Isoptericola sp. S6320L]
MGAGRRDRIWTWLRVGAILAVACVTGALATVFAWVWTDELVDGNDLAYDDLAGTWWQGASAGALPTVFGLSLCAALLIYSGLAWWWPMLLVLASGAVGAALGATERFPYGLRAGTWVVCGELLLGALVGLLVNAQTVRSAGRDDRRVEIARVRGRR